MKLKRKIKRSKLVSALCGIGNCGSVMNDKIDELIHELKTNYEKNDTFTIEAICYENGFNLWYDFNITTPEKKLSQAELKGLDVLVYQSLFK